MANTYTEQARRAAHPDPLTADLPTPLRDRPAADLLAALGKPPPPESYRYQALCAQTDPEEFFPEKGSTNRLARDICDRCPVKADCLAEALDGHVFGVWGGTSEQDRRAMRVIGWTGDLVLAYAAEHDGAVPYVRKKTSRVGRVIPPGWNLPDTVSA